MARSSALIMSSRKRLSWGLRQFGYFYHLYFSGDTPLIVYQMGKVASSSIYFSLKESGFRFVTHVHRMDPNNIERVRSEYVNRGERPRNESLGLNLYRNVIQKKRKVKLITLAREPISRNVSAFFQNYYSFTGRKFASDQFDTSSLNDIFMSQYSHTVPLLWFDIELKQTTNIDIYDYPFPIDPGYLIDDIELLIMRTELEDELKEGAINEFLDLKNFRLVSHNLGAEKSYASTCTEFKHKMKLPESYVEIFCDAEFTRHFYTDSEIMDVRRFWENRILDRDLPEDVKRYLEEAARRRVIPQ